MDNELARIEGADGIYRLQKAEGEKLIVRNILMSRHMRLLKKK